MKKLMGIACIGLILLAGCKSMENKVGSVFDPIIGTWNTTTLGVPTTLVFNADNTCTENTNALGILVTKNGTWTAGEKTIVQYWSNKDEKIQYYTFSTNSDEMTLSSTPNGMATKYTRAK